LHFELKLHITSHLNLKDAIRLSKTSKINQSLRFEFGQPVSAKDLQKMLCLEYSFYLSTIRDSRSKGSRLSSAIENENEILSFLTTSVFIH
jgi:hypothetical protein